MSSLCGWTHYLSGLCYRTPRRWSNSSPCACFSPNSGMLVSQKMHSTSCAFSFFFFLYDESYSEWSFCSAIVHNSCKKSDFSCVNFKGLQSGIYIWKDLLREEFLFFISTTGNSDYLWSIQWQGAEASFSTCQPYLSLLYSLHLKELSRMKAIYIWHNYLIYFCKR